MVGFCHRHIPTIFISDKFPLLWFFRHGWNVPAGHDDDDDDDDEVYYGNADDDDDGIGN